jgi:hypothetical protein
MALIAVTCESCGGSIATRPGQRAPTCLFCGAETLVETPAPEEVEHPERYIPFAVDDRRAQELFREWSRRKFWAPGEIQRATLQLNELLLPAWTWAGTVETHWAALIKAGTRSGRRPVSGHERHTVDGMLVPASKTLRRQELCDISPFSTGQEQPFDREQAVAPYELGSLTRSAATHEAQQSLAELHRGELHGRMKPSQLSTSCLYHDLEGRPLLLPVWIGAYRVGEKLYRVVLNGQSGALTGKAPISGWKVLAAVAAFFGMICCFMGVVTLIGLLAG